MQNSIGVLAAIWPCGIITLVDELFIAESKTQVYGSLHSFLHCNPITTATIGNFIHCFNWLIIRCICT